MLKRLNNNGMTLVEILVSLFILTFGILGSLAYFIRAMEATMLARDMSVATNHAEYVLEEVRSRTTIANITGTNWTTWANNNSLNTLTNEIISVTHTNAAADPLPVLATVTWETRTRSQTISLATEVTE